MVIEMKEKHSELSFCETAVIVGAIVGIVGILLFSSISSIKRSNAFEISKCDCAICENKSAFVGDHSDLDWSGNNETKN